MAKDITIHVQLNGGAGRVEVNANCTLNKGSSSGTSFTIYGDADFVVKNFSSSFDAAQCYINFSCTGESGYVFSTALVGTDESNSSSFQINLGDYYNDGSTTIVIYFEESGGGTGEDSDIERYYRCEAILSSGDFEIIKSKKTTTKTSITRPNISGYDYLGYVYHTSFSKCRSQVSDNTGDDRFDGTGSVCTPPSDSYQYIIFFYEKSPGWYCDSIYDAGTLSDDIDWYPKGGYGGFYTESLQIQGLSTTPNYNGYLSINVDSPPANFQTWLSKGLNLNTREEAIDPDATTAKEAVDITYLQYYAIASETNSKLGCRVEANSKIFGYAAFQSRDDSGYLNINLHYLKDKTLTYYRNDGTNGYSVGNLAMDSDNGVTSLYLGSSSYFTRSSYILTGWNTAADGSGTSYNCGQQLTNIRTDLTLYAQWKLNKYAVHFCNNTGVILSTATCDPGSSITMASALTAPAANIQQLGWSTTNSTDYRNYDATLASGEYACGATYTPTASLTIFYPIWQYKTQTIVFKNGYEYFNEKRNMGVSSTITCPYNPARQQIEDANRPFSKTVGSRTKNIRYKFIGWSKSSTAKKPTYHSNESIELEASNDETIYFYTVTQPYFYFQDAAGNNLIDGYNGSIQDFITTDQMKELKEYTNTYIGATLDFTSMVSDSKIKLSDYNILGTKTANTKLTAKDFYELQQAFNNTNNDLSEPPEWQPLTFTPVNESDTITIAIKAIGTPAKLTLRANYCRGFYGQYFISGEGNFPPLENKQSISFWGFSKTFSTDSSNYYYFEITGGPVIVTGSVLSLLHQSIDYQLPDYCFYNLFKDCTNIITAPELPSLALGAGSYQGMFQGCTGLTIPPSLPATTLGNSCYNNMFNGCTSLKITPNLPATTLKNGCYAAMFKDCASLKEAPKLLATTIEGSAYMAMFLNCSNLEDASLISATDIQGIYGFSTMFKGCSSLKHIKLAYTGNFSDTDFYYWVDSVASNGILEYDGEDTSRGVNAIPENWIVKKSS